MPGAHGGIPGARAAVQLRRSQMWLLRRNQTISVPVVQDFIVPLSWDPLLFLHMLLSVFLFFSSLFLSTCCGGAHGLWLIISECLCLFVLLARAPLIGCIQPGGKGEGLTILVEQEHMPSSPFWHGLSLALNHKGKTIFNVWVY